ncbi:MAG: transglutaminase-like domain-containing protein [Gammaproteobacteria bacterium]|nr:transglutaminase-like domain-containing protein [Gammaproteobacteria bacterium]
MKYSTFFVGTSIGIWGWFNQTWLVAGILIALVLLNPLISWRWDLNRKQIYRVVDLSAVLTLVMLVYGYLTNSDTNPIYSILKWLPVLIAPVLLAQIYSLRNRLPMAALFYAMRSDDFRDHREIDFSLPFATLALMAAGAANAQSMEYFVLVAIFVGAIIWLEHPGQFSKLALVLIFSTAVVVSYFGHHGLTQLHAYVQAKSIEFIDDWSTNPFKNSTSIGQIGELKLSDQIEFHVVADGPLLLHQSSYNLYGNNVWHASDIMFKPYDNLATANADNLKHLEIIQGFGADLVLALPDGIAAIEGLESSTITRTDLGVFKISEPPPWARYQVKYSGIRLSDETRTDLRIPDQHRHWLSSVSEKLGLQNQSPEQIATTIKAYFLNQFSYTLYTPNQSDADQALTEFMHERHAGHCEYFAMAPVFLLRYSGIPARLANGYSVQEYDPASGMYIVRRRHSHAWAIAKIGGSWRAVDTTPSQWIEVEAENAGKFQALSDWFYNGFSRINQWRVQAGIAGFKIVFGIFLVILFSYLGWFLYKGKRRPDSSKISEVIRSDGKNWSGSDSEFFLIERYYKQRGQARNENESIFSWARRMRDTDLENIVQLHYRYRFDPLGLSEKQRGNLQASVKQWLEKMQIHNREVLHD